jgi:sulfoxide reductase heme-binding subunit YedZ
MGLAALPGSLIIHQAHALASVAAASSPLLWYLTRAAAVSAYVVLTAAVLLGMLRGVARTSGERLSWITDELHQTLATLFFALVVLHLLTLFYDPFLPFSLVNLLTPLSEPYRPFAVSLGVLALYTLVIVLLSSWIRRMLPYRLWRVLHYASFATFALVTLHGILAGSDTGETWMRGLYAGAGTAAAFLILMRLYINRRQRSPQSDPKDEDESELLMIPAHNSPSAFEE